MTIALVTDAVEVRYGARCAVRATSLALESSGFVALVGPNGAGKSSLLKALAGLASHTGTITWQGRPLAALAARERARTIAYLAQASAVHWPLSARDVVTLGRLAHGRYGMAPSAADREAVEWALAQTATAELAERSISALSVGERARVLLARALAVRAPVLIVDEPIAMLDPFHQLEIMGVLARYARGADGGAPALVVAVLHDLTLAARFCGRVLLMSDGRVVEDGTPAATLSADNVRRHYHVEPFVAQHQGEPVIVPWRSLGGGAPRAHD
jgi:iron complex transport system ATP-binding protein